MELEFQGVDVDFYITADECVKGVVNGKAADLYILDIMLISNGLFPDRMTDQQLYTGLMLGCVIREVYQEVPIVFYSSLSSDVGLRYTYTIIDRIRKGMGSNLIY